MKINVHAKKNFEAGYSCSEAIIRGSFESGVITGAEIRLLNSMASPFSAGIGGAGCLCGAVAASQMVIGLLFGRGDLSGPLSEVKEGAKEFVDEFMIVRKATCCSVLSAGFDFSSQERRTNCNDIVSDASIILESIIKKYLIKKTVQKKG